MSCCKLCTITSRERGIEQRKQRNLRVNGRDDCRCLNGFATFEDNSADLPSCCIDTSNGCPTTYLTTRDIETADERFNECSRSPFRVPLAVQMVCCLPESEECTTGSMRSHISVSSNGTHWASRDVTM